MSNLPANWTSSNLGELCSFKYGKALPAQDRDGKGFPVFGSNGVVGAHSVPLSSAPAIVIGRKGSAGTVHFSAKPCSPIDTTYYIDEFESVVPRFLFHMLRSLPLGGLNRSTAIPGLNREDAYELEMSLAPLAEQQRIADKLDAILARVDACRDRLDGVEPLLLRFRQSVLASAFTGRLTNGFRQIARRTLVSETLAQTPIPPRPHRFSSRSDKVKPGAYALSLGVPERELPDGWRWTPLVDIARMESGHTPSRGHPEYWGGDVPWVSIPDARDGHGRTIVSTNQNTNQLGLANSAARLLPEGTVCLSRTASVGYVTRMGVPMATSQDFANWVCTDAINPDWLKYLFVAEKEAILSFGQGSTHTTVYYPELMAFHVALPPIEEQAEIVRRIDRLFAQADSLQARAAQGIDAVSKLPSATLAKAFRGELVPQDPSDEPAQAMLDRLKAQKPPDPAPRRRAGRATTA